MNTNAWRSAFWAGWMVLALGAGAADFSDPGSVQPLPQKYEQLKLTPGQKERVYPIYLEMRNQSLEYQLGLTKIDRFLKETRRQEKPDMRRVQSVVADFGNLVAKGFVVRMRFYRDLRGLLDAGQREILTAHLTEFTGLSRRDPAAPKPEMPAPAAVEKTVEHYTENERLGIEQAYPSLQLTAEQKAKLLRYRQDMIRAAISREWVQHECMDQLREVQEQERPDLGLAEKAAARLGENETRRLVESVAYYAYLRSILTREQDEMIAAHPEILFPRTSPLIQ